MFKLRDFWELNGVLIGWNVRSVLGKLWNKGINFYFMIVVKVEGIFFLGSKF